MKKFGYCSLSNNEDVLRRNLLRSPDLKGAVVSIQRDAESAAIGLNRGLDEIASQVDYFVCVQNDVYLPTGWQACVEEQLEELPDSWAVAGLMGQSHGGMIHGRLWSTGLGRELLACELASSVVTLDEVLLILRTTSKTRFDEGIPGFHLYGADVVLSALEASNTCHVVVAPVIHNSTPTFWLNSSYRKAQRYVGRKHRNSGVQANLVVPLDPLGLSSWRYNLMGKIKSILGKSSRTTKGTLDRDELDPVLKSRELGYE